MTLKILPLKPTRLKLDEVWKARTKSSSEGRAESSRSQVMGDMTPPGPQFSRRRSARGAQQDRRTVERAKFNSRVKKLGCLFLSVGQQPAILLFLICSNTKISVSFSGGQQDSRTVETANFHSRVKKLGCLF